MSAPHSERFAPQDLLGPLNVAERPHAPAWLYARGDLALLRRGLRVAVVGSRQASEAGLKRASRLARLLIEAEITVVSGLAHGIDTASHRSAIHHGGRTIAVIGTPLSSSYPRENRELQEEIARDHLLLSQFSPSDPVRPKNFVLRNRTMALISDASVIVEAGEGSGSLSQGWETLRLGRPLFLARSVAEDPSLRWPAKMLDHGALVLSEPGDLLGRLPPQSLREPADAPF